jgi:hypothetical protein
MPVACRVCGAEIADKALICYRCGAATAAPALKPAHSPRSAATLVATVLALVVLSGAALFLQETAQAAPVRSAAWIVLGVAVVLAVVFRWRRSS